MADAPPDRLPALFHEALPVLALRQLPSNCAAPPPGEVHLWAFAIDRPPQDPDAVPPLSAAELARWSAMRAPTTRHTYAACRLALRQLLATYLGCAPLDLEISATPGEKPRLLAPPGLSFSYSHAARVAAIAVSGGGEVGVDLEEPDPSRDFRGIADRYFHPEERAYLDSLGGDMTAFLRIWTAKEALLKATGEGLRGLERMHVGRGVPGYALRAWQLEGGAVLNMAMPAGLAVHTGQLDLS